MAVIQVESAGNALALSPRGGLGLMQIMPESWVELSVRYDLGRDPFDPHDNILAGTAYLREMLDRLVSALPAFLAHSELGQKRRSEDRPAASGLPR